MGDTDDELPRQASIVTSAFAVAHARWWTHYARYLDARILLGASLDASRLKVDDEEHVGARQAR